MPPGDIVRIEDIPFLDKAELTGGRFLNTLMFYDGTWRTYMPTGETGKFVEVHMWPAEACYFGKSAEKASDLNLRLLQLLSQHANFDYLRMHFEAIVDDLFNLSASLYKIDVIHKDQHAGVSRLAATEVEFILITCRSIFDHVQEIMQKLWAKIELQETTIKKQGLSPRFAGTALKGNSPRRAIELVDAYGLPFDIAAIYERHAPMFLKIRTFRDNLIHKGQPIEHLHNRADGFFVLKRLGPFQGLDIWDADELDGGDFATLRPILAQVMHGTVHACEEFAHAIASLISVPKAIAPGMKFYLRGYFNDELVAALNDAEARRRAGRYLVPITAEAE